MALDALLAQYHRQGQISGSALVRRKGQTLLDRGYGAADRANGRPNTPETAFQLASVSKQLTAAAILLLQEQGALSVQDSLATWLPTCPAAWKPIMLHHLLTHTSGLVHVDDLPELDFSAPYTQEDLRRLFQQPRSSSPLARAGPTAVPGIPCWRSSSSRLRENPMPAFCIARSSSRWG
jgi:CubicO group peptidase (beta-lactamase class C family)